MAFAVFGAVQPVHSRRRHIRFRSSIEFILQPDYQAGIGLLIRALLPGWRHHARPQLLNNFFPFLAMIRHIRQVQIFNRKVSISGTLAVALPCSIRRRLLVAPRPLSPRELPRAVPSVAASDQTPQGPSKEQYRPSDPVLKISIHESHHFDFLPLRKG